MTGRSIRSRTAPPAAFWSTIRRTARPRRCSTATATPTASASPMTASRCSSPKAGPAASTATGSRARRPARPNASSATCRAIPTISTAPPTARYWMAWLGMRTPSFDLSLRHPGIRKRMTRRLPQDEWLFPNINTGGVVKFDETGRIVETLGDLTGAVASDGHLDARAQGLSLYRRHPQQPRRPLQDRRRRSRTGPAPSSYWGSEAMILDPILDLFPRQGASPSRRSMARSAPTPRWTMRRHFVTPAGCRTISCPVQGGSCLLSSGNARLCAARRAKRRRLVHASTRQSPRSRSRPMASSPLALDDRQRCVADGKDVALPDGRRLHHRARLRRPTARCGSPMARTRQRRPTGPPT